MQILNYEIMKKEYKNKKKKLLGLKTTTIFTKNLCKKSLNNRTLDFYTKLLTKTQKQFWL